MPPAATSSTSSPNPNRSYYATLALPAPTLGGASPEVLTSHLVKKAYHRALLRWHPDKTLSAHITRHQGGGEGGTENSNGRTETSPARYTLDEIITAYNTLSTEKGRREYEREYRLQLAGPTAAAAAAMMREQVSGIWNAYVPMDVVDLDDFDYIEAAGKFYRGCRCGKEEGYVLWERELEEVQAGEVEVGCVGCSLWLRVQFEVVAEWEEEEEEEEEEADILHEEEESSQEVEVVGKITSGLKVVQGVGVIGVAR